MVNTTIPSNIRVLKLSDDELKKLTKAKDPRMGLASASSMERVYLCPGSAALEKQVKELPRWDSVRDAGSRVHAALAGEIDRAILDEDDLWMVEKCEEYEQEAVRRAFPDDDLLELRSFTEERLYLEIDGVIENSGEFDKVYMNGKGKFLILDYKTGYIPVADSSQNYQLRNYAVLTWLFFAQSHEVLEVEVSPIQPRCRPILPPRCVYKAEHLKMALEELLLLIRDSKDPKAKRFPSVKACTYCKALSVCREAATYAHEQMNDLVQLVAKLPELEDVQIFDATELAKREAIASGAALSKTFQALKLLDKLKKSLTTEIKIRIQSGAEVPDCKLKDGIVRRKVRDMWKFREQVKDFVSPREILDAEHPSLTAAKEMLAPKFPHKKGKELKALLEEFFTGNTIDDQNQPSVEIVKE